MISMEKALSRSFIKKEMSRASDVPLLAYVVYTFLVLLGTFHFVFAIFNFCFCLVVILTYQNNKLGPFMIYGTFFASIFKILQVTEMSLFTILTLIYILKVFVFSKKAFSRRFFLVFCIFVAFTVFSQLLNGAFSLNRNIKFFTGIIYVYFIVTNLFLNRHFSEDSIKSILYSFVAGVLVSSLMRLIDGSIFNISLFVEQKTSSLGIGKNIFTRFSGLYGDPNYYVVNTILSLVVLVFLFSKKEIKIIPFTILFSAFTIFTILTRSKSGFLMLVLPLFLLAYSNFKNKRTLAQIGLFALIVLVVLLSVTDKIDWFTPIVSRFEKDTDFNSFTTGRFGLWQSYVMFFKNNPLKFITGVGLSSPLLNEAAAHNTYIDIAYHLGLISGLLFIYLVGSIFFVTKIKRTILNYGAFIVILAMYFFLSCLVDIDLNTNCIVIAVMLNTPAYSSRRLSC